MLDFTKSQDARARIAITGDQGRKFVSVTASDAWLKSRKVRDGDDAQAVMVEHAYKLLGLKELVGERRIKPSSLHFGVTNVDGAIPLVPGTLGVSASTFCCICNDASPPECACVPC